MGNTKIDLNAFLDSIGPSTEEEVPLEPLFSDDYAHCIRSKEQLYVSTAYS